MATGAGFKPICDLIGVGVGPSNLSLAALADPVPDLRAEFFEARPAFRWHPGLLDGNALIQTSYLKDLVTLVDPTSRYSFLSFLKENGRLYRFIVADPRRVTRVEFEQYYQWVAQRLPSVHFDADVEFIEFTDGDFAVHVRGGTKRARSVVLATGLVPQVPLCAQPLLGQDVLHASSYDLVAPDVAGRRLVLVGGGQTGAELFLRLLQADWPGPREITWLSSRPNFLPLDDTPFTNELFFPNYAEHFRTLSLGERQQALAQHRLASDGIDLGTLAQIYRRLYDLDFLAEPSLSYRLLPGHRLVSLARRPSGLEIEAERPTGQRETLQADVVVLCTGFAYARPKCLAPIEHRIRLTDDGYSVGADFSIAWDGPPDRRIYVQNAARHSHGIADQNLSLNAWRSAVIVNSVCGRSVYDVGGSSAAIAWPQEQISVTDTTCGTLSRRRVVSDEKLVQAPMAKLSSTPDTEDIPPGMLLRVFAIPGAGVRAAPFELSHWSLEPDADSGDDVHEVREIWLIAVGQGQMTCGGVIMEVAAGDVIMIEPSQTHRLLNTGDCPLEVFSVWWST